MEPSATYLRYWGKAESTVDTGPTWHPFAYHSLDVATVATALWEDSATIRHAFAKAFDTQEDAIDRLRAWILFFVSLHDLGKLHALFQIKAPDALRLSWPEFDRRWVIDTAVLKGYDHGRQGFSLAMREVATWTNAQSRSTLKAWRPWLEAVMGHHGEIPAYEDKSSAYADNAVIEQDIAARRDWVEDMATLFLDDAGLGLTDPPPRCTRDARNLLAGFCSLCDWIGSNLEVAPYRAPDIALAAYRSHQHDRIVERNWLRYLGLIAPASPYRGLASLLGDDEQPRGIQPMVDALPVAAGLTIVEAPTGSGKTEAALAYAWRLLDAGLAESIVFALPTQASANAMLARCQRFAATAFGRSNLVLAHGYSLLNHDYQRLIEAGARRGAQGREEASVQCAAWLASSRKRVFLGQIGVCTVDQILLSVLPVRHNFVRAFGLHRSVLIVDEVHAYDAYMNGLLGEVLKRQKAVGGSAVLLSATLPAGIRQDLLQAWDVDPNAGPAPYPAIWNTTALATSDGPLSLPDRKVTPERAVDISLIKLPNAFPDDSVIAQIIQAAEAGARVGIVMNTVDHAQALAQRLREAAEVPIDLFHARFRLLDRQAIEQRVIEHYGRDAARNQGRILVATQVIEQSLDLDFDWLVTQICPVDLLFQRLGRLHRHPRPRPRGFEHPACIVLSIDAQDYGIHELIYRDARILWRTDELLERQTRIVFPEAYRGWIEPVYAEAIWDDEPGDIYEKHIACRDDQTSARQKAIGLTTMTLTQFRDDHEDVTSLTRDGEMSLSLLVLGADGALLEGGMLDAMDEHAQAEAAMLNTVPAPASWKARFAGLERDADGRIPLKMRPGENGRWISLDGAWIYSSETGLGKSEKAGVERPPTRGPAGAGN